MKDFTVRRFDGPNGKQGWYMYIGFSDEPSGDHTRVDCYGTALVLIDGRTEYWFRYWFGHSPDWNEITEMVLKPVEKYTLGSQQMFSVGSDIINHIKSFISMGN